MSTNVDEHIFDAVQRASFDDFMGAINSGANPNAKNSVGWSVIHACVARGNVHMLSKLIELGVSLDVHATQGQSPLHIAVETESANVIPLLCEHISPDVQDYAGTSPLLYAAIGDHFKCIEPLLRCGASVDFRGRYEFTAMHASALAGNLDAIKLLVEYGADISALSGASDTPVKIAIARHHSACVLYLLENGATLDGVFIKDARGIDYIKERGWVDVISLIERNELKDFSSSRVCSNDNGSVHL